MNRTCELEEMGAYDVQHWCLGHLPLKSHRCTAYFPWMPHDCRGHNPISPKTQERILQQLVDEMRTLNRYRLSPEAWIKVAAFQEKIGPDPLTTLPNVVITPYFGEQANLVPK